MDKKEILIWVALAVGSGLGAVVVTVTGNVATAYTMQYLGL